MLERQRSSLLRQCPAPAGSGVRGEPVRAKLVASVEADGRIDRWEVFGLEGDLAASFTDCLQRTLESLSLRALPSGHAERVVAVLELSGSPE